jgi:hypothetical protein
MTASASRMPRLGAQPIVPAPQSLTGFMDLSVSAWVRVRSGGWLRPGYKQKKSIAVWSRIVDACPGSGRPGFLGVAFEGSFRIIPNDC